MDEKKENRAVMVKLKPELDSLVCLSGPLALKIPVTNYRSRAGKSGTKELGLLPGPNLNSVSSIMIFSRIIKSPRALLL